MYMLLAETATLSKVIPLIPRSPDGTYIGAVITNDVQSNIVLQDVATSLSGLPVMPIGVINAAAIDADMCCNGVTVTVLKDNKQGIVLASPETPDVVVQKRLPDEHTGIVRSSPIGTMTCHTKCAILREMSQLKLLNYVVGPHEVVNSVANVGEKGWVVGTGTRVVVYDSFGNRIREFSLVTGKKHVLDATADTVAVAVDGKLFVSLSADPKSLDSDSFKMVAETGEVTNIAIDPDTGNIALTAGDNLIRVYSPDGREIKRIRVSSRVYSLKGGFIPLIEVGGFMFAGKGDDVYTAGYIVPKLV